MQQHHKRSSCQRPWGVVLLGAIALSVVVEAVGAASQPAALRGVEHQQRVVRDETRFDGNAFTGGALPRQSAGPDQNDMVQTVQFMAPGPAQDMMGPPPFPVPRPGYPDGMPLKFPPRKMLPGRHQPASGALRLHQEPASAHGQPEGGGEGGRRHDRVLGRKIAGLVPDLADRGRGASRHPGNGRLHGKTTRSAAGSVARAEGADAGPVRAIEPGPARGT